VVLSGNTSVSNCSTSSSFRIRKSISHGYSCQWSQVFGLVLPAHILLSPPSWSSSHCSVTATSTPPSSHPLSWHLAASRLRWIFLVAIQKPASVTPLLLAVANAVLAHPQGTPHQSLRHSYPILPSDTAAFPSTAPACRSTLSHPSSGGYTSLIRRNYPLSGVYTFLLFTHSVFADVAKGSPLLPACFFPFYFLHIYV